MRKAQKIFLKLNPYCSWVHFSQFGLNNPWTSMKELEFNSDQKAKVSYLNEKTSETFQYLTLILIMPVLAQLNPNSISPSPQQG